MQAKVRYAVPVIVLGAIHAYFAQPNEVVVVEPQRSAVVITGCSSGLGLALALDFARQGYLVFAGVRRFPSEEIEKAGATTLDADARARVIPISVDVADRASVESAAAHVQQSLREAHSSRQLVAIVNNAGISSGSAHIASVDPQALEKVFRTNVFGAVHMVQLFLPQLAQPGGRIVNIGSLMGEVALPHSAPYSTSKFALTGLSDTMRYDLQGRGISVSLVQPGFFKSNICSQGFCKDSPQDTADAVLHAVSSARPRPRYITASLLGFPGWLVIIAAEWLPRWLVDLVVITGYESQTR